MTYFNSTLFAGSLTASVYGFILSYNTYSCLTDVSFLVIRNLKVIRSSACFWTQYNITEGHQIEIQLCATPKYYTFFVLSHSLNWGNTTELTGNDFSETLHTYLSCCKPAVLTGRWSTECDKLKNQTRASEFSSSSVWVFQRKLILTMLRPQNAKGVQRQNSLYWPIA